MANIFPHPQPIKSAPEYAVDAQAVDVRRIDLGGARAEDELNIGSRDILWVVASSSLGANLPFRFNTQSSGLITAKRGLFISGVRFQRLYLNNTSQPGEWVEIFSARQDEVGDLIRIENPSTDENIATLTKATVITPLADVACPTGVATLVLASNSTRRIGYVQNVGAGTLVIGDASVSATRGIRLAPNERLEIAATENVYAFNNSGAAGLVALMETAD